MRGLTYEQLAEVYELRHGFDAPTPWKVIARVFDTTANALRLAIYRLEREGLNRDANGHKPLSRPTPISDEDLRLVDRALHSGFSWVSMAARMNVNPITLRIRWRRWKQHKETNRND